MHKNENGWKIDRSISIAVVMTSCLEMAGVLLWATELDARVSGMERQQLITIDINEKFARLEERLDNLQPNAEVIRRQLDRLTERE